MTKPSTLNKTLKVNKKTLTINCTKHEETPSRVCVNTGNDTKEGKH